METNEGGAGLLSKSLGVMTFHETMNYGANLQALALCKVLREMGWTPEVVNYDCSAVLQREVPQTPNFIDWVKSPKWALGACLKYPKRREAQSVFKAFSRRMLPVGPQMQSVEDIDAAYDIVVVGSDQVWNLNCTGGDDSYFLPRNSRESRRCKRIAYAASFGSGVFEGCERERCGKALEDFDSISVRESSGVSIVRSLSGREDASVVLDPTLLLRRAEWEDMDEPVEVASPFVFAYVVGERDRVLEAARLEAKRKSAELVIVEAFGGSMFVRDATVLYKASPSQFVWLAKNAESVVTSSFHGMCFSIIFKKTATIIKDKSTVNGNSRIDDLLISLGADYDVAGSDALTIDFADLGFCNALDRERRISKEFLRRALGAIE